MQAGIFTYHAISKMNACQGLGLNCVWLLLLVVEWVLGVILLEFVSGHLSWWRGGRAVARCLHCRAAGAPLSQGAAAHWTNGSSSLFVLLDTLYTGPAGHNMRLWRIRHNSHLNSVPVFNWSPLCGGALALLCECYEWL